MEHLIKFSFANKDNRLYAFVAALVFTVLTLLSVCSFIFYLHDYSRSFAEVFKLQNLNLIENGSTLELGPRLENTKKSGVVKCIQAISGSHTFYQMGGLPCKPKLFSRIITIKANGNENFKIIFEISLPFKVQIAFFMFLFFNICIFIAIYFWLISYNKIKLKSQQQLSLLAQQVAHDIRSPLSALSMITSTLKDIPEEKRIIIRYATQRINDIANDLLSKGKSTQESPEKAFFHIQPERQTIKLTVQFLPALVDLLVSEKRMQHMKRSDLEISSDLDEGFGAFALVDGRELKRVLSNLINNSVEAFTSTSDKNKIVVKVKTLNSKQVVISIQDNGKGIPEHLLSKLGKEQLSYGKEGSKDSGSGLGLYHAKKTIEALQGEFKIESIINQGTTISLTFLLSETPSWFATKINLTGKTIFISLDDDISIHQLWADRLKSLGLSDKIQHIKFQSHEDFTNYINQNVDKLKEMLIVSDYELLNQGKTGLDVIEDLVLEKYSILVTNRYEENQIQERVREINLKILPKTLSGVIPFIIDNHLHQATSDLISHVKCYNWILLDDDELVHMTWKLTAQNTGKSFIGFKTLEEFNTKKDQLDKKSYVYVDSNLSNGIKGEDVALALHNEGFTNLYISTGFESDQFSHLNFLKGVIGKDPPL
ncbi:MAG: sensor histidine kinase [Pseudobdellovibrio sp.]